MLNIFLLKILAYICWCISFRKDSWNVIFFSLHVNPSTQIYSLFYLMLHPSTVLGHRRSGSYGNPIPSVNVNPPFVNLTPNRHSFTGEIMEECWMFYFSAAFSVSLSISRWWDLGHSFVYCHFFFFKDIQIGMKTILTAIVVIFCYFCLTEGQGV